MTQPNNRLQRHFEGPEVLGGLLADSGCELTLDEVIDEFECAVEEGTPGHEVVSLLWEREPRFPTPAAARRTFSNLFGLWDQVATGAIADLVQLPELAAKGPITAAHADRAWREYDAMSARDQTRARDRFDNAHSEVVAFLTGRLAQASAVAMEAALELAFETWWISQKVRAHPRLASYAELVDIVERETPEPEPEPALAGLVTVSLWERAAEDEAPLSEDEIPVVEAVIHAVRVALSPVGR
jgi:hypothetical protein